MTGAEFTAGGAAVKAAGAVFGEEQSAKDALVAASTETQGFHVAAEIRGQRMAMRQAAVLNVMRPLYWCVGVRRRHYFDNDFVGDLAAKTASIPNDALVTPPAYLAGPAIEGLGYAVDEVDLKGMFLNLLAAAADGRRSDVHPSYVDTIRQLAPDEADLLRRVLLSTPHGSTIVAIRYVRDGVMGWDDGQRHILPLTHLDGSPEIPPLLDMWIENWVRLGLVDVSYETHLLPVAGGASPYAWADQWPVVEDARAEMDADRRLEIRHGTFELTQYGRRFATTVFDPLPDDSSPPSANSASSAPQAR